MTSKQITRLFYGLLAFGSFSFADTITQKVDFGSDGIFDQFDCSKGILNFIRLDLTLNIYGGQINYDNDSASEAIGTLLFGAAVDIKDTSDVSLLDSSYQLIFDNGNVYAFTSFDFILAPDNGDGKNNYDESAPDGAIAIGTDKTVSDSGFIASSFWSQGNKGFLGTGKFVIPYSLISLTEFSGENVTEIEYSCTPPVWTDGSLTLTYDYNPIPEPGGLCLMAAGVFTSFIRKKYERLLGGNTSFGYEIPD